ncbi:hypothetical protein GQ55_1G333500 [Panicum hallii var. hallii]|uniref:Uncharacterized protein n=1 Tax=Panicum hallii var. hallii TaxID=1504633 RepID=A0A2T7FA73_9POAL|nr:hypothetical protein GQ55_1G333500 [Panicum hallii var. hallii]
MELEAAAPALMRRDGRKLARCPRLQLDTKTVTAIEQSTGESVADAAAVPGAGPGMRVKIVLSKQQLKQVAAAVAGGGGFALPPALEQLVSVLRRQHAKKQAVADVVAAARRRGRWSPALQSIPEECF